MLIKLSSRGEQETSELVEQKRSTTKKSSEGIKQLTSSTEKMLQPRASQSSTALQQKFVCGL